MSGGLIIPDKETAKALNDLVRHTAIARILSDIRIDMEICEKENGMSAWLYDGYTKIKVGTGRHARMVENHVYKCLHCGWSVRVERSEKPPMYCPNCKSDMRERRTDE